MHSASLSRCSRLGRAVPVSSQAERKQQTNCTWIAQGITFQADLSGHILVDTQGGTTGLHMWASDLPIPNVPTVIPPRHSVPPPMPGPTASCNPLHMNRQTGSAPGSMCTKWGLMQTSAKAPIYRYQCTSSGGPPTRIVLFDTGLRQTN